MKPIVLLKQFQIINFTAGDCAQSLMGIPTFNVTVACHVTPITEVIVSSTASF